MLRTSLLCLLYIAVIASPGALAASLNDGITVATAPYTVPGGAGRCRVIDDGTGGVIGIWCDNRSGAYDVYAQRADVNGEMLWQTNGVTVSPPAGESVFPDILPDGRGGAIVAWHSNPGRRENMYGLYLQRLDANGDRMWATGGVLVSVAASTESAPALADDGDGGAILAWSQGVDPYVSDPSHRYGTFAQRVDRSGKLRWAAGGVRVWDSDGGLPPLLVADRSGGAIVILAGGDAVVSVQKLDRRGHASWALNDISNGRACEWVRVATEDGAGGAIIAWTASENDRPGMGRVAGRIRAQRVDDQGNVLWRPGGLVVCDEGEDQQYPAIVSDGAGGAVVAWIDGGLVYARRLSGSGSAVWGTKRVEVGPTRSGGPPEMVSDGAGGAILVWDGGLPGRFSKELDFRVLAQRIDSDGKALWPGPAVTLYKDFFGNFSPTVAIGHEGGVFVAWLTTKPSEWTLMMRLADAATGSRSATDQPWGKAMRAAILSFEKDSSGGDILVVSHVGLGTTAQDAPSGALEPRVFAQAVFAVKYGTCMAGGTRCDLTLAPKSFSASTLAGGERLVLASDSQYCIALKARGATSPVCPLLIELRNGGSAPGMSWTFRAIPIPFVGGPTEEPGLLGKTCLVNAENLSAGQVLICSVGNLIDAYVEARGVSQDLRDEGWREAVRSFEPYGYYVRK